MIDLHAHSTHSDGTLTPRELVVHASQLGLKAVALTDHDVISGLAPAARAAKRAGIRFIPGVELDIGTSHGEFHLLGLNLTGSTRLLDDALVSVRQKRAGRNERICEKMSADGIAVSLPQISALAGGDVVSRLHFAQFLVREKHADSIDDAFKRFLGRGMPYHEPKAALAFEDAVGLIRRAGGFAIIAHPLSLALPVEELQAFLLTLRRKGLDGLEAYHSDYDPESCRELERFGSAHGFLITAGSDFHGATRPQRKLGFSSGGMCIEDRFMAGLLTVRS